MKYVIAKSSQALILGLFFLVIAEATTGPPDPGVTFEGRVVRVVDGDTIEVEVKRVVRVRLLDCWAPETRTKDKAEKQRGLEAKKHLRTLAHDRDVTVFVPVNPEKKVGDSFSFDRALGHVWVVGDEQSLSEKMVESNHATKERNK